MECVILRNLRAVNWKPIVLLISFFYVAKYYGLTLQVEVSPLR